MESKRRSSALLIDLADAGAVPDIAEVALLARIAEEPRAEARGAVAALMAHAVIEDAVGARAAQLAGETLGGTIVRRVIDIGELGLTAAKIMQQPF